MTEPTIAVLPPAPLWTMEIWSNPGDVAARFQVAFGVPLPAMGRSVVRSGMTVLRYEPAVWLIDGDAVGLEPVLAADGALCAIGGGIVRVRIEGPAWRTLLMEGGMFDAEADTFTTGCTAATIIDHVAVRLLVESGDACAAFVPASYAAGLVSFWTDALSLGAG